MTLLQAKDVVGNYRIRSPRKLREAAQTLMASDIVKYKSEILSLVVRAKDAEMKKEGKQWLLQ